MKNTVKVIAVLFLAAVIIAGAISKNKLPDDIMGRTDAVNIAMKQTGLSGEEILKTHVELGQEFFTVYYRITLESADGVYTCTIDACTGQVISFDTEN
ncbi:MAG: hypothetical protein Q4E35_02960 [Eubacteriales bacterium]|nr:hypothetical protein [Eubacteriales bacterium]